MDPLDKLFLFFFTFTSMLGTILASYCFNLRLLWTPLVFFMIWGVYIYYYRGVYQLSHIPELSIIERGRGLSFFFCLSVSLALHVPVFLNPTFANLLIGAIGTSSLSIIVILSIPKTFLAKQTALFNEKQKWNLNYILQTTVMISIFLSIGVLVLDFLLLDMEIQSLSLYTFFYFAVIGILTYRWEKASRKLSGDLAMSLKKSRWHQRFLKKYGKKK